MFAIELCNIATKWICPICGLWLDSDVGPVIVVREGPDHGLVCDQCAEKEAPILLHILEAYRHMSMACVDYGPAGPVLSHG